MSLAIRISRAAPLVTLQDAGRFGYLQHGVSASGPMDQGAYGRAGDRLGKAGAAIEFTRAGLAFEVEGGGVRAAFDGGAFALTQNGKPQPWPVALELESGDRVDIAPGDRGLYGYVRFDHELAVEPLMGSRATNLVAGLGGFEGRALRAGDRLPLQAIEGEAPPVAVHDVLPVDGPIRFVWGLHADLFKPATRQNFMTAKFAVSRKLDRMGVRLDDSQRVFGEAQILSLVSDAIVPGDIQILGDGTPIVLMRDHQPTGGYPRIGTVISADFDRFAQLRVGSEVSFVPVTTQKAHGLYLASQRP